MTTASPVDRTSRRNIGWMMLVLMIALSLPAIRLAQHVRCCQAIERWPGAKLKVDPVGPGWLTDRLGERGRLALGRPVSVFVMVGASWPHEVHELLDNVAQLESLKEVYLDNLDDECLLKLRSLRNVTRLRATWSRMTATGLAVLDSMPGLRYLRLSNSISVDDRALVPISRATELEELCLSTTGVTDAGLAQLTSLRKLRVLELDNNAIHDEGLMALAPLTSLERLSVSGTGITDEGLAALRRALPNLEITDD